MLRPAVFLDRDGVLNAALHQDWVRRPDQFVWLPGSVEAVRSLNALGWPVVLATNQSGVGRGIMSLADVEAVHEKMVQELELGGAHLDGIVMCPHAPDDGCDCRKPRPGLFYQAADQLGLDLTRSVMIGDSERDLAASTAAGCACHIAVSSGLATTEDIQKWRTVPDHVFPRLADAVEWMIDHREESCWK